MISSRRKFLGWIAVTGSAMAIFSRMFRGRAVQQPPLRMLTQDGRLVEIDRNKIPSRKAKATSAQVASWIWKDQKL